MRRRRHEHGARVLAGALVASAVLYSFVGIELQSWANRYLAGASKASDPVKVVRISQQAWSRSLNQAKAARDRAKARLALPAPLVEAPKDAPKPAEKPVEPPKPPQDKLTGQIVETPPTADDSSNSEAKYLSKHNANVKEETVARMDQRDPSMKRVTNRLQHKDQRSAPEQPAVVTPNLTLKGDGLESDRSGDGSQSEAGKKKFVLEVPDLKRRDEVQLKLSDLPGINQVSLPNQTGSEAMKGNGKELKLEMGDAAMDTLGGEAGGRKGAKDAPDRPLVPSLTALMPNLGTIARMSGAPVETYMPGVKEGDGTFLNTKEFKYATFFYRIRDSIGPRWESMVAREYRRRDPSGNVYGRRDRSTLLEIRLSSEGQVTDIRVEQTSGVEFLDNIAVQAFRLVDTFPNPPVGLADEDGHIRFHFNFTVVMSTSSLGGLDYR